MKLFTVGPVEMYEETLIIGGQPIPYFRTDEFSEIMLNIQNIFLELLSAPSNSRLTILTASGTGAMEAAVCNTLTPEDKALVISGGSFGERFKLICERHCIPFTSVDIPFGGVLNETMLIPYENKGYTALIVNLHETSVGQLYDLEMLGNFCNKNGLFFIVDAISTFLADPFNMKRNHVNLVITASQKALALPPGLSFIITDVVAEKRIIKNKSNCLYFDLQDYFSNMERGQTPYTPAVGIILQLSQRLSFIKKKGLDNIINEHKKRAGFFRQLCMESNIKIASYPKSNALTPIIFPKGNAYEIFLELKDKYGIILTPSGGSLSGTVLRIGHLGNLRKNDYQELVERLVEVM